ncbi:uncharacterized protein LOC144442729 [Glandiceps talaboti]
MRLKPTCSWCKDYSKFEENKQLAVLLPCFKKLCEFIADTPIAKSLATTTNGGFSNPVTVLQEGMAIVNNRASSSRSSSLDLATAISTMTTGLAKREEKRQPAKSHTTTKTKIDEDSPSECELDGCVSNDNIEDTMNSSVNTSYSVSLSNSVSTKMKFKRKKLFPKKRTAQTPGGNENKKKKGKKVDPDRPNNLKLVVIGRRSKEGKSSGRKGCRCGTGNLNITPGKFTCYGNRCPCYVGYKGCVLCRCRGCKNPYTTDAARKQTEPCDKGLSGDDSNSDVDVIDD